MPIVQLVLATALWGGLFAVGKLLSPHLPPFTITLARYGLAAVVIVPLALREFRDVRREDVPMLALVGLLSSLFFNGCLFFALRFAPAGDAVLAPATVPILMTLIGAIWLGQQPGWRKSASLGVSLLGVGLVFSASMQSEAGIGRAVGDLLGLGAALSWSLYLILSARFATRYSPVLMTAVTCLAGGLGSLPLAIAEGGLARFMALPGMAWLQIAYLALLGSVGAFWLWSRGAQQLGPAKAAAFMNLVPIFGILSSVWLLNEELGATQLVGIALVLAGVWGATLASRSTRPPREARMKSVSA